MSYFQACCLLIFSILGTAIIIDPVTKFVISNPIFVIRRIVFSMWYLFWTDPAVVIPFTRLCPVTAMEFYFNLIDAYQEVFPEAFDEDGNLIERDPDE